MSAQRDGRRSILVADDDPDILELVTLRLERAGFDVIQATDGDAALELACRHTPVLAVLDVSMPGRNGYDVTRELRRRDPARVTRVLLLTARAQEADKAVGAEAGADAYMTKPFSPQELLAQIEEVLER